ncbi:MAG: hypothetical protein ACOH1X_11370 [Kaistella sp.]
MASEGEDSALATALTSTLKEKNSLLIYACGIGLSFVYPVVAVILYYVTALMWIIRDLRIEKTLK